MSEGMSNQAATSPRTNGAAFLNAAQMRPLLDAVGEAVKNYS